MRVALPHILSLILCVVSPAVFAQELVKYSDVKFNSALEKEVLDDHFLNNKTDYFKLLMANGVLLTETEVEKARTRLFDFIATYNNEKFLSKKNEKKVKTLYDDTQKNFLSKFDAKQPLEGIFYDGSYNAVTSTALFSLIFHELHLRFDIKDKASGLYLLAYPAEEKIMVEATNPFGGYYSFNSQFKADFLKMLKEKKQITPREFESSTTDALFDKYYFATQNALTILNLVGLQYTNDAMLLLDASEFGGSFCEFEKAFLFYPSDRLAYMLLYTGTEALHRHTAKDTVHARLLGKLARYKKLGVVTDEMIEGEFNNALRYWLLDNGSIDKMNEYRDAMLRQFDDVPLKEKINFLSSLQTAKTYYGKDRYKEAISFLEQCLSIKPRHTETNELFLHCLYMLVGNHPDKNGASLMEKYAKQFPVLLEDNNFNRQLCNAYLSSLALAFKSKDAVQGELHKSTFEKFYKEHNDVRLDDQSLGEAYSSAALYYFKKGQTTKARKVISDGLQISPHNYELRMSQKMIEQ